MPQSLRARGGEWELGTLATDEHCSVTRDEQKSLGKIQCRRSRHMTRALSVKYTRVGQVDQSGICVVAFGPPPREDRVRNGFRQPDGGFGSGQFAESALDTLCVARNRWPLRP
jgi:hypothetical protein